MAAASSHLILLRRFCVSSTTSARFSICRHLSTTNSLFTDININKISLSEPVPDFPVPIYAKLKEHQFETKITTLSNGLRVASQNKYGQFCTVGVIIDSGSRYEVAFPSGISHFLEKLAFNSTVNFGSRDAILEELEKQSGICDCQGSRDTMVYAASADSRKLDPVVRLIADSVLRPKLTDEEVEKARQTILFELEDINMRPDQEPLLFEMIHAAAYRDNTLGLPKICPAENMPTVDRHIIFTYLKHHFTPQRMVVAGVGVDHDALLESADRYFVQQKPIWEQENLALNKNIQVDNSVSQYTGGLVKVEKDLSNVSLGPTPIPELVHFVLGLESSSHQDSDFISYCVLNMLMGGGGSFSAGGPGKGMYTRLYTNVLNRFHWIYNATAYNHAYNDSGIFCIHGSAHPSQLKDVVGVIVKEFTSMAGRISDAELNRAKTQLQSMLLMNLESRPIVFEDIGRQVLASGKHESPEFYIEEIGKINEDDIHRIACRLLKSRAAIACLGDIKALPSLQDIEAGLVNKEGHMPKRFSLFR